MGNQDNRISSLSSPNSCWKSSSPDNLLLAGDEPGGGHNSESTPGNQRLRNRTILVGAASVMLLVATGVTYFIISDRASARQSAEDAAAEAQVSIGEASRRLDALPAGHPLRARLSELEEWRAALHTEASADHRTGEIREQAQRYTKMADEISDEARAALNALDSEGAHGSDRNQSGAGADQFPETTLHGHRLAHDNGGPGRQAAGQRPSAPATR